MPFQDTYSVIVTPVFDNTTFDKQKAAALGDRTVKITGDFDASPVQRKLDQLEQQFNKVHSLKVEVDAQTIQRASAHVEGFHTQLRGVESTLENIKVLFGTALGVTAGSLLLQGPIEAFQKFNEAGLAVQRSIQAISAVAQKNTFVPGTSVEQQISFNQSQATQIQNTARQKLAPLGIGGEQEALLVQGIVTALGSRGLSGSPDQIASIARNIGGAIAVQRPQLLSEPGILLRELQDLFSGSSNAKRTILFQLLGRQAGESILGGKSVEEITSATEKLSPFATTAEKSDNVTSVINRLNGALGILSAKAGTTLLDELIPALQKFTEVLSKPEVVDAIVKITKAFADLAATGLIALANSIEKLPPLLDGLTESFNILAPALITLVGAAAIRKLFPGFGGGIIGAAGTEAAESGAGRFITGAGGVLAGTAGAEGAKKLFFGNILGKAGGPIANQGLIQAIEGGAVGGLAGLGGAGLRGLALRGAIGLGLPAAAGIGAFLGTSALKEQFVDKPAEELQTALEIQKFNKEAEAVRNTTLVGKAKIRPDVAFGNLLTQAGVTEEVSKAATEIPLGAQIRSLTKALEPKEGVLEKGRFGPGAPTTGAPDLATEIATRRTLNELLTKQFKETETSTNDLSTSLGKLSVAEDTSQKLLPQKIANEQKNLDLVKKAIATETSDETANKRLKTEEENTKKATKAVADAQNELTAQILNARQGLPGEESDQILRKRIENREKNLKTQIESEEKVRKDVLDKGLRQESDAVKQLQDRRIKSEEIIAGYTKEKLDQEREATKQAVERINQEKLFVGTGFGAGARNAALDVKAAQTERTRLQSELQAVIGSGPAALQRRDDIGRLDLVQKTREAEGNKQRLVNQTEEQSAIDSLKKSSLSLNDSLVTASDHLKDLQEAAEQGATALKDLADTARLRELGREGQRLSAAQRAVSTGTSPLQAAGGDVRVLAALSNPAARADFEQQLAEEQRQDVFRRTEPGRFSDEERIKLDQAQRQQTGRERAAQEAPQLTQFQLNSEATSALTSFTKAQGTDFDKLPKPLQEVLKKNASQAFSILKQGSQDLGGLGLGQFNTFDDYIKSVNGGELTTLSLPGQASPQGTKGSPLGPNSDKTFTLPQAAPFGLLAPPIAVTGQGADSSTQILTLLQTIAKNTEPGSWTKSVGTEFRTAMETAFS